MHACISYRLTKNKINIAKDNHATFAKIKLMLIFSVSHPKGQPPRTAKETVMVFLFSLENSPFPAKHCEYYILKFNPQTQHH
jgi:hypothetical protein